MAQASARSNSRTPASECSDRPLHKLLARLDSVRESGRGQWLARCPAHEDRSPSLAVRETHDGTVLVHDFAGCGTSDILAAVGLELADLFPNKGEHRRRTAPGARWNWRGLLLTLRAEATVALIGAEAASRGEPLTDDGRRRLEQAVQRITRVANLADGGR